MCYRKCEVCGKIFEASGRVGLAIIGEGLFKKEIRIDDVVVIACPDCSLRIRQVVRSTINAINSEMSGEKSEEDER